MTDEELAMVRRLNDEAKRLKAENEKLRAEVAFFAPYGDLICDMITAEESR